MKKIKKQTGISLLEVLIAIVVIGVGLMGLAGMQVRAMKSGVSSVQRSQALILSYEMLDILRLDKNNAQTGSYNGNWCLVPTADSNFQEKSIKNWVQSVKDSFGDIGSSCAEIDCDTNSCTTSILWDDSRVDGGNVNERFEMVTRI